MVWDVAAIWVPHDDACAELLSTGSWREESPRFIDPDQDMRPEGIARIG
jgi:hypothetical protein